MRLSAAFNLIIHHCAHNVNPFPASRRIFFAAWMLENDFGALAVDERVDDFSRLSACDDFNEFWMLPAPLHHFTDGLFDADSLLLGDFFVLIAIQQLYDFFEFGACRQIDYCFISQVGGILDLPLGLADDFRKM